MNKALFRSRCWYSLGVFIVAIGHDIVLFQWQTVFSKKKKGMPTHTNPTDTLLVSTRSMRAYMATFSLCLGFTGAYTECVHIACDPKPKTCEVSQAIKASKKSTTFIPWLQYIQYCRYILPRVIHMWSAHIWRDSLTPSILLTFFMWLWCIMM